jgi:dienelactone hydrolase
MSEQDVRIFTDDRALSGNLTIGMPGSGLVLFAHGSGSSRFSPRNRFVAESLQKQGCGTLLIDLLTDQEEQVDIYTRQHRFDIGLLARRLVGVIDWAIEHDYACAGEIGLFGASTGAAAALVAASERPEAVGAVVSRGGRPDLAGEALSRVKAPCLFIIGGEDHYVLELNITARAMIPSLTELEIVPGATHLFEETGALEKVAAMAGEWFDHFICEEELRLAA